VHGHLLSRPERGRFDRVLPGLTWWATPLPTCIWRRSLALSTRVRTGKPELDASPPVLAAITKADPYTTRFWGRHVVMPCACPAWRTASSTLYFDLHVCLDCLSEVAPLEMRCKTPCTLLPRQGKTSESSQAKRMLAKIKPRRLRVAECRHHR